MNAPLPVYVPQPDSVAGRVCAWFRDSDNRDEELTVSDIALKFGAKRSSVITLLNNAIASDMLRRIVSSDKTQWVIVAGANLHACADARDGQEGSAASQTQSPRSPTVTGGDRISRGMLPVLESSRYPVVHNVPCPPPRAGISGTSKYSELLRALARPGDSRQGIPASHRGAVSKACDKIGKQLGRRFVCRSAGDGTFGIWRES